MPRFAVRLVRRRGVFIPFVLYVCGTTLLASPGWSDETHGLGPAIRAYDEGKLQRALTLFHRVAKRLRGPRQRARAWLYLGFTQVRLRNLVAARRSLAKALVTDPAVAIDRARAPAEAVAEIEALRSMIAGKLPVHVRVRKGSAEAWYTRRRTWGWISMGFSAAATLTATLFGSSAKSSVDEIRSGAAAGTLNFDRYEELTSSTDSKSRIANVFFGVAGAAAITGLVLLIVGDKQEQAPPRAWQIVPAAGGAAVAVSF